MDIAWHGGWVIEDCIAEMEQPSLLCKAREWPCRFFCTVHPRFPRGAGALQIVSSLYFVVISCAIGQSFENTARGGRGRGLTTGNGGRKWLTNGRRCLTPAHGLQKEPTMPRNGYRWPTLAHERWMTMAQDGGDGSRRWTKADLMTVHDDG